MTGFKDHFSSHAAAYAAYRPSYPPELAAWLGSIAPTPTVALDCGCGSGQLSVLLAEHFETVIATDPSAQLIAKATPHPRIDYRVAPAEASGVPDGSIDLLTAAQAAHWFDQPAFFAEARRIVKPGGAVALITYVGMEERSPIEPIVNHFRTETLRGYWPPERALVENHYRDITLPFEPIEVPPFFIEVQWPFAALVGYLDTWSAVRELERSVGRGPLEAVTAQLAETWGAPDIVRTIRWPLTILAGRC